MPIYCRSCLVDANSDFLFILKLCSVIGCPLEECLCGCSSDLCDCGRHVRRLADRGSPGVEQHIHCGQRPDPEQITPRLVWRDLFDMQRAPNHTTDDGHLLKLAQLFVSVLFIIRPRLPVLTLFPYTAFCRATHRE